MIKIIKKWQRKVYNIVKTRSDCKIYYKIVIYNIRIVIYKIRIVIFKIGIVIYNNGNNVIKKYVSDTLILYTKKV